jgi:RND superfamily putative drug exporter
VVFRSVLVPLKAALGFLLSVSAALGAVVAVFQWGWLADFFGVDQPGPVMSTLRGLRPRDGLQGVPGVPDA